MATSAKRPEADIINEIARTYGALSPENLCMDGEASRAHVRREGARLEKKLRGLFTELGREIDECEAYRLYRG